MRDVACGVAGLSMLDQRYSVALPRFIVDFISSRPETIMHRLYPAPEVGCTDLFWKIRRLSLREQRKACGGCGTPLTQRAAFTTKITL